MRTALPEAGRPSIEDCSFYCSTFAGGQERKGPWDLRPGIDDYLGGYDFAGRSVLELGPASGFVSFHMEERGASVTSIDTDLDRMAWNLVPQSTVDLKKKMVDVRANLERVRNAFWFCHDERRSSVKTWYGEVLELPHDFGRFDVGLFAAVLLHCRDVVGILARCAPHIQRDIIIVERSFPQLGHHPVCWLDPSAENGFFETWWRFTPEFFVRYLGVLGFGNPRINYHSQLSVRRSCKVDFFTVTASRPA